MARISFTEHPAAVNETYGAHFITASGFGLTMLAAGCACLLHGIFPFWFGRTGSDAITTLHRRMVTHRVGGEAPLPGTDLSVGG
ncbi:MAG: DUF6356 family protein [Alphaproteobacteria bacterium]|nr:DUF6356 family protein [Alphaproteobacteria bacterium]